jgi:hypothetical protein
VCNTCLSSLFKESEDLGGHAKCPHCREQWKRGDVEVVTLTSKSQWDELVDVATAWSKMDSRREVDSSEEEREENFIDDGDDPE